MKVVFAHRGRFELWAVPYRRVNGGMVGIRRVSPEKVELVPVENEIETGAQSEM